MRQSNERAAEYLRQKEATSINVSYTDIFVGVALAVGFYTLFWLSFALDVLIAGG
jgi:hypothetical protein